MPSYTISIQIFIIMKLRGQKEKNSSSGIQLGTRTGFFLNDIKEILGYRCRSVLHVNEKNDSTLIWFTDSIPKPAGPLDYFGFPGLVLEVFDQVRGWHILAGKVERGAFGVTMPKGTMIIPREDYVSPKK